MRSLREREAAPRSLPADCNLMRRTLLFPLLAGAVAALTTSHTHLRTCASQAPLRQHVSLRASSTQPVRTRHFAPLLASYDDHNEPAAAGVADGGGVAAWAQENLLQGVSTGPATYAVCTTYFVQGVLGLASLARTYYMKETLGLSPAEASALLGITSLPWVIKPVYGFLTGARHACSLTLCQLLLHI